MRLRNALLFAVMLSFAATACSRLTFIKPNHKMGKPERSVAPEYDFKDSPSVKRDSSVRDLVALAQERLREGRYDEAEQKAKQALRIDAGSMDAYTLLALVEDQRGHSEQAGGYYAKAAELSPRDGVALNNYGAWLCTNQRVAESLTWFDRALADQTYQQRASALANVGACALRAGQTARVERDLRAALSLEPDNAVALGAMAEYQYRSGHYMEARAFSERRLASAPANGDALQLASRIEDKLGDRAAADRYGQRVRTEFPQAATAQPGERSQP